MKAAIFYTGKYGSTKQYAEWLGEATDLPVYDLNREVPDPAVYDTLILGSSIIVTAPTIKKWLFAHWEELKGKKLLLFTVSGTAPGHSDLILWLNKHLTEEMIWNMQYEPLRGRMNPKELPWHIRTLLRLASRFEKDPEARNRMKNGFDYMDRDSLIPILEWIDAQKKPKPIPRVIKPSKQEELTT